MYESLALVEVSLVVVVVVMAAYVGFLEADETKIGVLDARGAAAAGGRRLGK